MSDSTIRKVVIEVGIKTSMSAAMEGLQGIDKAASEAGRRIQELDAKFQALNKQMGQSVAGQAQIANIDRSLSAIGQFGPTVSHPANQAGGGVFSPSQSGFRTNNPFPSSVAIGRSGYAQSVQERDEKAAQTVIDQMKKTGHLNDVNQATIDKLREHLIRRSVPEIRTNDREDTAGQRDAEKAQRQQQAEQLRHEHETARFSSSRRSAQIQFGKGAAQFAAAMSGSESMVGMVVATEGLANLAQSAAEAGVKLNPLTAGIAAFGATAILTARYLSESVVNIQRNVKFSAEAAFAQHGFAAEAGLRHFHQQTSAATAVPFTGDLRNSLRAFDADRQREEQIRAFEGGDASPEMKLRFRHRISTMGGFEDQQRGIASELEFRKREARRLRDAHVFLEAGEESRQRAAKKSLAAAQRVVDHSQDESAIGFAHRQLHRAGNSLSGILGFNTGIGRSGFFHTQELAKAQAEIDRNTKSEEIAKKGTEAAAAIEKSKQQQADIERKIAELQQQQLTTTRAAQQEIQRMTQSERQRVQSNNIAFGSADVGSRRIALNLQAKAERIEAARKANVAAGRPADEGVEQFTQFEMQQQTFGGIAGISMRRQAAKTANDAGFKQETDLPELEKQLAEEMAKPIAAMRDAAEKATERAEDAAKQIGDAVKAAFPLQEILAAIRQAGDEMKREFERRAQLMKNTFGPGA